MSYFATISSATVGKNPPVQGQYESFDVTPSDSLDLALNSSGQFVRRIKVTGAGNVNVNLQGGGTAVLTTLAAGQVVECAVSRILSTSTTATGIIAMY
jgi:hypothetical protein